jgi:hypothetical protein
MKPDPDSLFFLVGTGRCGSTLLQAMLSSHPRLYIPPELRYFGRHDPRKAFGDPLEDSDVDAYLARCREDIWWEDMGLDRAAFDEAVRSDVRSARDIYLWVLGHIADKRGNQKPRIGEKTPYYSLWGARINELFPKAQFIHIYRDPRDVVASYLDQYWCPERSALGCATFIKRVFRRTEQLAHTVGPARYCGVQYETLVADPERELRRLCSFLREDYDPAMLKYGSHAKDGYMEVEEVWKGMTREPLTPSRIGRHTDRLSPRQIWTVEQVLGPLLIRCGYRRNGTGRSMRWQCGFWLERLQRRFLYSVGIRNTLLDEQAVLARRNELVERSSGRHPALGPSEDRERRYSAVGRGSIAAGPIRAVTSANEEETH